MGVALIDRQHCVGQVARDVLQHHQPHPFGRHPEQAQRAVLGDDIILAVAGAAEKLQGRRPIIAAAVIVGIRAIAPAVDEAVDLAELGQRRRAVEAVEQVRPGAGGAGRAMLAGGTTAGDHRCFRRHAREHSLPLRQLAQRFRLEFGGPEQAGGGRERRCRGQAGEGGEERGANDAAHGGRLRPRTGPGHPDRRMA